MTIRSIVYLICWHYGLTDTQAAEVWELMRDWEPSDAFEQTLDAIEDLGYWPEGQARPERPKPRPAPPEPPAKKRWWEK